MEIKLNLINKAEGGHKCDVVIFQKNVAHGADELPVAWHVAHSLLPGARYSFVYETACSVAAHDSLRNYTPQMPARPGELFQVTESAAVGLQIRPTGTSTDETEIQVVNGLPGGEMGIGIYRSERLLAARTGIAQLERVAFAFHPTICIAAMSHFDEGSVLPSASVSDARAEINLMGIASADIVMTGGHGGEASKSFKFTLENVAAA